MKNLFKIVLLPLIAVITITFVSCNSNELSSHPKISVKGSANAVINDGILSVTCSDDNVITDITVNDSRIWLTNGKYEIADFSNTDEVKISTQEKEDFVTADNIYSVLLSFYDTDTNSYSLTWHTKNLTSSMVILSSGDSEVTEVTPYCDEGNGDYVNRAVFYNLDYSEKYTYKIVDENADMLFSASFSTDEKNPEEFTFMHISDTQDEKHNGKIWAKLMENAYSHSENVDLILHTGDMVQYGGDEELWQKMLGNVSDYVTTVPVMLTSGNHSYWSDYTNGYDSIEYNHTTINIPQQNSNNGIYYSFDVGNVHFTVLSSGDSESKGVGSKQRKWLESDLKSTDKKWKIVAIHNPLYSPGKYGSSKDRNKIARSMQKTLGKIFNDYSVDLVLEGHDHAFALTKPMSYDSNPVSYNIMKNTVDGIQCEYIVKPEAPVYLMSSTGGNQNREVVETYEPSWFIKAQSVANNTAGYSLITVSDSQLSATYYEYNYDTDSSVYSYSWGIEK